VREEFLAISRQSRRRFHTHTLQVAKTLSATTTVDGAKVGPFYFLAKKQLAKGYRELLSLMAENPDVLALLDEVTNICGCL